MPFYSNSTHWVGWLFVLGCSGVICTINPLHADNPLPPESYGTSEFASELQTTLRAYAKERELFVHELVQGDLDGDGQDDLAAQLIRHGDPADSYSALVIALASQLGEKSAGVAVHVDNALVCPHCVIGSGSDASLPTQSMRIEDGRLTLCESWGQSWRAEQCARLRLDSRGVLRVEQHVEHATWSSGPSSYSLDFDFINARARRSYAEHPLEPGYPLLEREAAFSMLFAQHVEQLPALELSLDEAPWSELAWLRFEQDDDLVQGTEYWSGRDDLSFRLAAVWSKDAVLVAIEVRDQSLLLEDCASPSSLLNSDHIELWLDTSAEPRVLADTESAQEHRRVYQQDPFRHAPDGSVINLAISPGQEGSCVTPLLPRDASIAAPPAVFTVHEGGYRAVLMLPASLFGEDSFSSLEERGRGIGLTVDVHDIDDETQTWQVTRMASSALVWGDPFSFGELLLPKEAQQLPEYPLDWGSWLHD
jgi:hypothetical protein